MMTIPDDYVWLVWSSALLLPWLAVFIGFPRFRRMMLWASLFTTPFGLTEPLFVPEYWSPPSLFNLALTTGFDIESLIFCFGIGGIGAALYSLLTGQVPLPVAPAERHRPLHRHHYKALAAPFVACTPKGAEEYQCMIEGQDLSKVVLYNGGAKSKSDVPADLKAAEDHARSNRLGVWQ